MTPADLEFCATYEPVRLTGAEVLVLREQTLKVIDQNNGVYLNLCLRNDD